MKKFWKIAILAVMAVICACGLLACGDDGSNGGKSGLQYKKYGQDEFYTVYDYIAEDGVKKLDLGEYNKNGVVIGRILDGAFDGNDSLTELIIPTTVTKIDQGAFKGMRKLEKLTVPFIGLNAIADASYNDQASTEKAIDLERTFGHFFGSEEYNYSVSYTQKFNAGDSDTAVRYIPMSLKEVSVVPANDYNIPMFAFSGNNILEKVVTDAKVKQIGENAFENCTRLNSVTIDGVTKIHKNAFKGATALKTVSITAVTEIGDSAFQGSGIKEVSLLATVTYGENVYRDCKSLTQATVNIASVPYGTFYGCVNLVTVNANVSVVFGNYSLAHLSETKTCAIVKATGVTVTYMDLAKDGSLNVTEQNA